MTPSIRWLRRFMTLLLTPLVVALPSGSSQAQSAKPVLDADTRLQLHAQHLEMQSDTPFTKPWTFIGPEIMSGRVTDIAVPPQEPFTFYVATASGGVWKTINEGTTWQPLFENTPSASVGAIAIAPSQPTTVWVGLGESNIFRSSMAGVGVYKSTDTGETWTYMGLGDTQHIARIVVHPTDPNVVYVAASGHEYTNNPERGIYKSTNGGITWKRVLYENPKVGAIDLVMDPSNPEVLYASMWDRIRRPWSDPVPGPGGGLYKTTNAGKSWTKLTAGLPDQARVGRMGLAISASRPNVVYTLIDNHEIARKARPGERDPYGRPRADVIKGAEVYRSDDHGETWDKVSPSNRMLTSLYATYGWVFGQIRVDPSDENTVYILGVPLLKSTDGGQSFRRISDRNLHGDHHALWIHPTNSNYLISGNDGGINISYDGGETFKNIENMGVVQFYNVAFDMEEPFNVYGSIQDNNSWMGPVTHRPGIDAGTDWKRIPGGEASYIAVDPEDSNILYSEGFYGSFQRSTMNPRRTERLRPQEQEGEEPFRGQWLAPFVLSTHNRFVVYHGMQYVFRSVDRGDHWEKISPDLTYNDPKKQGNISFATISSLHESPLKFGLLYAGTDDGRVHVTRNGGVQWTEITQGTPARRWVSRVTASRFRESTVYLAKNGKRDNDFAAYLFRSDDYGKTWKDISSGIPGGPINVIKEDPRYQGWLYVGTDLGVYLSQDDGQSWQVLGSNLPSTFVHDLIIHPRDHIAVIATHGRGMWKLDVGDLKASGPTAENQAAQGDAGRDAEPDNQ